MNAPSASGEMDLTFPLEYELWHRPCAAEVSPPVPACSTKMCTMAKAHSRRRCTQRKSVVPILCQEHEFGIRFFFRVQVWGRSGDGSFNGNWEGCFYHRDQLFYPSMNKYVSKLMFHAAESTWFCQVRRVCNSRCFRDSELHVCGFHKQARLPLLQENIAKWQKPGYQAQHPGISSRGYQASYARARP